ncbi:hypothetical protein chiPu_0028762 [Chiloscyllium punctatum]|uniref:Uncharacterized protein n=1 Tax=Chiloscyllium punctatum TaxID=137246 RepID=A0A401TP60_CHIPU|nr:hypothetical protein [Chiloscyllium punctatum]
MDLAVEELGLSMDEIREWIDQELEKVDLLKQRRAALQELENWVEKKEAEMAHVDGLFEDASRSSEHSPPPPCPRPRHSLPLPPSPTPLLLDLPFSLSVSRSRSFPP